MIRLTEAFLILNDDLFCMNKSYFCRNFLLTDWGHMHCENTIEICSTYWNALLLIFSNREQIIEKFDFVTYFSCQYVSSIFTRWKFQNQCYLQGKKLVPSSFEVLLDFSRGLSFSNVNFRDMSCERIFAEKVEIQSPPLNHSSQGM